jgi:hypothetical protein
MHGLHDKLMICGTARERMQQNRGIETAAEGDDVTPRGTRVCCKAGESLQQGLAAERHPPLN